MEWYRRKTWTKTDEEEFFSKLGRARKDGRAQYLKIQAIELVETKDKKLLKVAETLLNKVLTEYPENRIEKSPVLHTLGNIYKIRKNYQRALDYYKQSLDFENIFPNVITTSYLDYSELVVKTGRSELFDFVETTMENKLPEEIFPITKYKICSILSIINKAKTNNVKAEYYADLADKNANEETSGLRYHKYLGVVTKRDSWLD